MIIIQKGNCKKCGTELGEKTLDSVQSTNVSCSKCKKSIVLCRKCKNNGCECGGKYLDAWDRNPGWMY